MLCRFRACPAFAWPWHNPFEPCDQSIARESALHCLDIHQGLMQCHVCEQCSQSFGIAPGSRGSGFKRDSCNLVGFAYLIRRRLVNMSPWTWQKSSQSHSRVKTVHVASHQPKPIAYSPYSLNRILSAPVFHRTLLHITLLALPWQLHLFPSLCAMLISELYSRSALFCVCLALCSTSLVCWFLKTASLEKGVCVPCQKHDGIAQ